MSSQGEGCNDNVFWQTLENRREEARAYSNLGSAYHSQRDFDKAISYHTRVLELSQELVDRAIEMRAYAGLGHAARCMQVGMVTWLTAHRKVLPVDNYV